MGGTHVRSAFLIFVWTFLIIVGMIAPSIARGVVEDSEDEGPPVLKSGWSPYV